MSIQLQEVLKTDTLEIQRQKFNTLALDTFNVLAGGTNLNVGTIGIDDGTQSAPGLYFGNEVTSGIFRASQYKWGLVTNTNLIVTLGDDNYQPTQPGAVPSYNFNIYQNVKTFGNNTILNGSITNIGRNYPTLTGEVVSTYESVVLSAAPGTVTNGSGATATVDVTSIAGSVTNAGSGYLPGIYGSVPVFNFSRIVLTATGVILSPGENYVQGVYPGVPLTGGSGTGFTATITVNSNGFITDVDVTDAGTGYVIGDNLGVSTANIGGGPGPGLGAAFGYAITEFFDIASSALCDVVVTGLIGSITSQGAGYVDGTYTNVPLTGGSGQGATATFSVTTGIDVQISVIIQNSGTGYVAGDVLQATFGGGTALDFTVSSFGEVASVTFTDPGQDYLIGDVVTLDGIDPGSVNTTITNNGGGYVPGQYVNVPLTGGSGSGILANISVDTRTTALNLSAGGSNYLDDGQGGYGSNNFTNVAVTGGTGSALTLDITVTNGVVTAATINQSGFGYTVNDVLTIVVPDPAGQGSGAEITITEIGAIASLNIAYGGFGYAPGNILSVNNANLGGSGSGFSVRLDSYAPRFPVGSGSRFTIDAYGSITSFTLNTLGSNFSNGNVLTLDDPNLLAGGVDFEYTINSVGKSQTSEIFSSGDYYASKVVIGNLSNTSVIPEFLDVNGSSRFRDQIKLAKGSQLKPALSFYDKPNLGLFTSQGNDSDMQFVSSGGVMFKYDSTSVSYFKDMGFFNTQITDTTLFGGSGYTDGSYTGVTFEGGSGSGIEATVFVSFGSTIGSGGSGYGVGGPGTVETYENVTVTGGSGSNAVADVEVTAGVITKFSITFTGPGYLIGDTVSIDPSSMFLPNGNPSLGNGFSATLNALGSITKVDVTNSGSSYVVGDELTLPQNSSVGNGAGFKVIINTIQEISNGQYTAADGTLELVGFKANTAGLNVNDDILIQGNTVRRSSNGNLNLTANNGFVDATGTTAFKVPVGSLLQRPQNPVAGLIRFNNESQSYEAYDGANWGSLGGTRDVDGNTYILPESSPGANENVLFFYNDGTNSLDVAQNLISLYTATAIESVITGADIPNIVAWEPSGAATAATLPNVNYVHYNYNLYSVDTTGTFDASTPPTHTTGTVTNGTVDLTYVSSTYGSFTLSASSVNINVENALDINGGLIFTSTPSTSTSTIGGFTNIKIGSGLTPSNPENALFNITNAGALQVNSSYGSAEAYTTLLDSGLRSFTLKDLQTVSTKLNLVKGTTNSANTVVYNPTLSSGAKVTVLADNTTTGEKEIIELSIIDNGSDIYNIEIGDVYTASKLVDVEIDYNASNNVRLTCLLDASVATADIVIVTVVSERIRK